MGDGGGEHVVATILRHFNRSIFEATLILARREGAWLELVPPDVTVHEFGVRRVRYGLRSLVSLLRQERPDVILSFGWGNNVMVAVADMCIYGSTSKLVFSERNTLSIVRSERRSKWLPLLTLSKVLYRRAHRIIAVSKGVAEDLASTLSLPKDLIVHIDNPIVDELLLQLAEEPIDHPWFNGNLPVILSVGRLIPQKDQALLLRAFARVRERHTARLMILGEGLLRPELKELAAELGIERDVEMPGFVNNPYPYMRRCSVYVASSRFEGLNCSLVEAMACGAPVVSTDCPFGPSEVIKSGNNGLLVPVANAQKLAEAIELLLDRPDLRRAFADHGVQVRSRFCASTMVRQYEEVLLGSLAQTGSASSKVA